MQTLIVFFSLIINCLPGLITYIRKRIKRHLLIVDKLKVFVLQIRTNLAET